MKKIWLLLVAAVVFAASPGYTVVLTFQDGVDGYAGTSDAHIISWDGDQNQLQRKDDGSNGGNDDTPAGTLVPQNAGSWIFLEEGDYGSAKPLRDDSKAILIKFDLSSAPKGFVKSAQIGLYYWFERSTGAQATEGSGTKKNPHSLYVNRILKAWSEGESTTGGGVDGDNAPDNSGEVTWNSTGSELWQAMGAEGPEDIAPPDSVTQFDPAVGGWVWFNVTDSARIWLADAAQNNGVKIGQEPYPTEFLTPDLTLPDGKVVYRGSPTATPGDFEPGAHDFISSENTNAELRPKLVIEVLQNSGVNGEWSLFK